MSDKKPGNYQVSAGGKVFAWVNGVPFEDAARKQVENLAAMPFVFRHVAVMPDVHGGIGATIGSVIATERAIIPAAVGVDIGCGMVAARTTLRAEQLPDSLAALRSGIEAAVPHGRTDNGGENDRGAWGEPPPIVRDEWARMVAAYEFITIKHPKVKHHKQVGHLGTLGTGNHFIEVCLDEEQRVWVMLHSGSRGVGNRIGQYFIEKAKEEMRRWYINLPDVDLAYLPEGSPFFADYLQAVEWAQEYAATNRKLMLLAVVHQLRKQLPLFSIDGEAVNCHHNYVSREHHHGRNVLVTRKGAVRAREGDLGIIPGSMGARSYIVRGKGHPESFSSCSHGAGRKMSRTEAKRRFTLADHEKAVEGVECRRDVEVLDETPGAYKSIDDVMAAQSDLVEPIHTLKQILCVKG